MRKYLLNILGAVFFFLILLPVISGPRLVTHFSAEAIDLSAEKDHRALRFEHKKLNSRLDQLINDAEIQGSVEVNKSETVKSIGEVSQKLADIKTWLNDTLLNDVLMKEIRRQEEAGEKLRVSLTAQFGELKGKLAEDIEALSQNNERYLLDFSRDNNDRLKALRAEIRALRAEMHGSLASFKDFFRDELIPFFEKQYEADRKALREEVTQAKTEPEGQSDVNRETSSGNLGTDVQNETNSEFMERMLK